MTLKGESPWKMTHYSQKLDFERENHWLYYEYNYLCKNLWHLQILDLKYEPAIEIKFVPDIQNMAINYTNTVNALYT